MDNTPNNAEITTQQSVNAADIVLRVFPNKSKLLNKPLRVTEKHMKIKTIATLQKLMDT
jgi:hypothetical protein